MSGATRTGSEATPERAGRSLPSVSVIIPCFSRSDLLRRAVQSVVRQTVAPLEIIVVDDASPESLAPAVDGFTVEFLRRETRGGPGAARNTGLAVAKGDVIAFLDSDDEWMRDKLARQLEHWTANAHRGPVLTFSGFAVAHGRRSQVKPRSEYELDVGTLLGAAGVPLTASVLMVDGSVVRDGDLRFDERLPALEDLDFVAEAAKLGPVLGQPDVLVRKYRDVRREHAYNLDNDLAARRILRQKYAQFLGSTDDARFGFDLRYALSLARSGDRIGARTLVTGLDGSDGSPLARQLLLAALAGGTRLFELAARATLRYRRHRRR